MSEYFKNKCFVVTGASSGIGRAIAELLAYKGANIVGMARSAAKLKQLTDKAGDNILGFAGDVTSESDCRKVIDTTIERFAKLDGLIHSAGVSMRALARDASLDVYRLLMDVNFFAMLALFKYALPHLEKSQGHLAAVSSMMGKYATQERSGYNASKFALQGFMDSVRIELMDNGIHVMVISPGFVKTEGSINALTADCSPYGKIDKALAQGLESTRVAEVVIDGLEKRKRDVFPAGIREKFGLFLSKWAPSKLDRFLHSAAVK